MFSDQSHDVKWLVLETGNRMRPCEEGGQLNQKTTDAALRRHTKFMEVQNTWLVLQV